MRNTSQKITEKYLPKKKKSKKENLRERLKPLGKQERNSRTDNIELIINDLVACYSFIMFRFPTLIGLIYILHFFLYIFSYNSYCGLPHKLSWQFPSVAPKRSCDISIQFPTLPHWHKILFAFSCFHSSNTLNHSCFSYPHSPWLFFYYAISPVQALGKNMQCRQLNQRPTIAINALKIHSSQHSLSTWTCYDTDNAFNSN